MKWLTLSLLLCVVISMSMSQAQDNNSTCGSASLEGKLSVTGQGVVKVSPDTATVRIAVSITQDTAAQARDQAANITTSVRSALASVDGIDEEDIKTSSISLYPKINYPRDGPEELVGYTFEQTMTVTVNDLNNNTLSEVLDTAVVTGGDDVRIDGVYVELSPDLKRQSTDAARKQAVEDAKMTAQLLADAGGVELGVIKSMADSNVSPPPPISFSPTMGDMAKEIASVPTPVAPEDVEVTATISVEYSICNVAA